VKRIVSGGLKGQGEKENGSWRERSLLKGREERELAETGILGRGGKGREGN